MGVSTEITGCRAPVPGNMDAYERVLGDAMAGDASLFAFAKEAFGRCGAEQTGKSDAVFGHRSCAGPNSATSRPMQERFDGRRPGNPDSDRGVTPNCSIRSWSIDLDKTSANYAPGIVTAWPRPGEAESGDGARGVTPSLLLSMVVE